MSKGELIIIRGPQGAGKSTLAEILEKHYGCAVYEADMYFVNSLTGKYEWDGSKMSAAHDWCRTQVENQLKEGRTVIVSNTTISKKELDPYLALAEKHDAKVWEIIAWGKFQNVHGVPEEKVQDKRNAFYLNR